MKYDYLEKHFPQALLQRAVRDEAEVGWRIEDVPAVIDAARKAALVTSGGHLRVFIPEELGGGTCTSRGQGIQIFTSVPRDLPWAERVEQSAQAALSDFELYRKPKDLVAEGRSAAGDVLKQLGRSDPDISSMLAFVWYFCDAPDPVRNPREKTDAEKTLEDAKEKYKLHADLEGARALVLPLAEQGNPLAQMVMADTYYRWGNHEANGEEMIKWYRRAAELGHAQAWYCLHIQYRLGSGVKKDIKEAANCLRIAADQGHVMACSFLGSWYRTGTGVTVDYGEAFKYLQQAANYGRPESQGELGEMYRRGSGIPTDYVEAYFWLSLAVRSPWNCTYLPRRVDAAKNLTPEQIQAVKRRVAEWKETPLPRAANAPYFIT